MRISKGFIRSSLIYTVAGTLPMASGLILMPFYIKYLSTDLYGVQSVCIAFSMLVQILATYSFDTSLYVHYHELKHDRPRLNMFVSSAFIFMLLLGAVLLIFFTLSGELIFTYLLKKKHLSFFPYGFVSVFIGIFMALFKVYNALLQTREKPEVYLWANIISFIVIVVTSVGGMQLYPGTLVGPLGGRLLAGALMAIWVLIGIFREYGWHFKSPWRQTSARFNAYTFAYQVLQWVVNYFDRVVITVFMPLSAVGLYDFAQKCLSPVDLVLNGLNSTITPKIIQRMNQQKDKKSTTVEINRYYYGLVSVILLLLCLSIFFIPWLVNVFIQKSDYAEALRYIPFVALIFIFRAMRVYFVVPYSILKKMDTIAVISFFISGFKIGLMAYLIVRWGLYGVVASAVLAYGAELVALWYYLKRDYAIRFNAFKLLIAPLLMFLIILAGELLLADRYPFVVHLSYCVACAGLLWIAYRNEVKLIDPFKILK